jgi:hypothetical protein
MIIAQNGKVTLKVPVRSVDEKSNVVAKAAAVVGDSNVTDEVKVACEEVTGTQGK